MAIGLKQTQNPLVCGFLKMYEGTPDEVTLPVYLNSKFILGPEGLNLNISGISGLAAKNLLRNVFNESHSGPDLSNMRIVLPCYI